MEYDTEGVTEKDPDYLILEDNGNVGFVAHSVEWNPGGGVGSRSEFK